MCDDPLYQCAICEVYSTDTLEVLRRHTQVTVNNGTYLCNLCLFRTKIKTNFQVCIEAERHVLLQFYYIVIQCNVTVCLVNA